VQFCEKKKVVNLIRRKNVLYYFTGNVISGRILKQNQVWPHHLGNTFQICVVAFSGNRNVSVFNSGLFADARCALVVSIYHARARYLSRSLFLSFSLPPLSISLSLPLSFSLSLSLSFHSLSLSLPLYLSLSLSVISREEASFKHLSQLRFLMIAGSKRNLELDKEDSYLKRFFEITMPFCLIETFDIRYSTSNPEANILDAKKLVWSQVNPKLRCTELFLL
jgi:hypothetical protein